MVSHQSGLFSRWSLIRVVSHQGGLSSGWSLFSLSLIRIVSDQVVFRVLHPEVVSLQMVSSQGGLSLWRSLIMWVPLEWSLIRVVSRQVVSNQVVSHEDGL